MQAKDRIIVALDVDSAEKAAPLLKALSPFTGAFKIGLELLTAIGAPQAVRLVHNHGGQVFFDGKFNDIPNTLVGATKAVAALGVKMFDVHMSSGRTSVEAAVRHKGRSALIVVTVLTSFTEAECQITFGTSPEKKVIQFAEQALLAGADGIVCSPQELSVLRSHSPLEKLWKITPGVRPTWAQTDDQARWLTPREAVAQGATHLVIGRPITQPPKSVGTPADAIQRILEELS
jgi:orotidine-5'-phosphate decarboxylase